MESIVQAIKEIRLDIDLIKQRMDSFVNQITEFKKDIYTQAQKNVNEMTSTLKRYTPHLQNASSLSDSVDVIQEDLNSIRKKNFISEKDFQDNTNIQNKKISFLYESLKKIKDVDRRIKKMDGIFKRFNFEEIVSLLEKIETEYQNKVSEALKNISIKKVKRIKPENVKEK